MNSDGVGLQVSSQSLRFVIQRLNNGTTPLLDSKTALVNKPPKV